MYCELVQYTVQSRPESPQFGCLGPMTSSLYVLAWMAPKSFEFVITNQREESPVYAQRHCSAATLQLARSTVESVEFAKGNFRELP